MTDTAPALDAAAAEVVPIEQLVPYPGNAKQHDIPLLRELLRRHGQYRPAVVQTSTRHVLVGNGMLEAARAEGWPALAVVWKDVDDDEARRLVLSDNRSGEVAGYDTAALVGLLQGLPTLEATGYDQGALDALLAASAPPPPPRTDPDDAPATGAVAPVSARGDLWTLGPHRLLCGDAFDRADLDRLVGDSPVGAVLTDPPYGMNLDTDYSKLPGGNATSGMRKQPKKYRAVKGDDAPFDASPLRAYFHDVREQFWFGADYYRRTLTGDDRDGSWLVWDKRKEDGSQDDVLGSSFETLWSASPHQRRLLRHYWCGAFGAVEARNRMHPTQKPVGLLTEVIERWIPEGAYVADPFAGSGSLLIAAHHTDRRALLMEFDPLYVDVICGRWERHTGNVPLRNGQPVSFQPDAA